MRRGDSRGGGLGVPAELGSATTGHALGRVRQVLPSPTRVHNLALVLRTLFHRGAMSRADLARSTQLTRVTISDLVAELIAGGFVVERGTRESSGPGKPAILVDLNREGFAIVGIDMSGSDFFRGAILSLDGEILVRRSVPLAAQAETSLGTVVELARQLVSEAPSPLLGIGVGTPGVIDDRGVVLTAPNFGWSEFDLRGALALEFKVPVVVANDANAAIVAESTFGRAGENALLIKIGRGVGSGLLIGGKPMRGGSFAAGEIGHVTVGTDGGPACRCGRSGCLESWISQPALSGRLAGSRPRVEVLSDAGRRLGIALAPVVGVLDLPEIVVSGPPELLGGPFLEVAAATLRARTLAPYHQDLRVRMTELGDEIVLRGAAVMVLSDQLGVF